MMSIHSTLSENYRDLQQKQLSACEAALVLSRKQQTQAVHLLLNLCRDGDAMVRIRAAECFMEIGGEWAVMGLMNLLDDPRSEVRIAAIGGLGILRAHQACDKLEKIVKSETEDIPARISAARTLGKLGRTVGLLLIIRLLNDDKEYIRRSAASALKDIIGQVFPPTQEGVRSAKRYLEINLNKYFSGGL